MDPFAPLDMQLYFHGRISRPDAESLIKSDGEFLVRESTNKPGQYVLTGKANGRPQHLLLIDKSGKVSVHPLIFHTSILLLCILFILGKVKGQRV